MYSFSLAACLFLALIGLITVFDAILTGRLSGQKLQCLHGNPMGKKLFPKLNFTQFMNRNVKILSRRLYSPSLKNVGWIEDAQLIFLIFHTLDCNFFPAQPLLHFQIYYYSRLHSYVLYLSSHPSHVKNFIPLIFSVS